MSCADVHFAIGASHEICEDYGLAGGGGEAASFAAIADGCSTAPYTDIGARLLCHATERRMRKSLRCVPEALAADEWLQALDIVRDADAWRAVMGLPADALDATLGMVFEHNDGTVVARLAGDGVVAARRRDGSGFDYIEVTCSVNAPTYLSYLVKRGRGQGAPAPLAAFQREGGGVRHITRCAAGEMPFTVEERSWTSLRKVAARPLRDLDLSWRFCPAVYDTVAIMTDGVSSFRKRVDGAYENVALPEVLASLMDFKTLTPGFVKRRARRFLNRDCARRGWLHSDDIAIAAVAVDAPSEH